MEIIMLHSINIGSVNRAAWVIWSMLTDTHILEDRWTTSSFTVSVWYCWLMRTQWQALLKLSETIPFNSLSNRKEDFEGNIMYHTIKYIIRRFSAPMKEEKTMSSTLATGLSKAPGKPNATRNQDTRYPL